MEENENNDYILCSRCQSSCHPDDIVETIEGELLCFGCDAKRLEEWGG